MSEYIKKSEAIERALYTPIASSGPVDEKDIDAWVDGTIDAQEQVAKSIRKIPAEDVVERKDLARVQVAYDKVGQALDAAEKFYMQGYNDAMTDHNLMKCERGTWGKHGYCSVCDFWTCYCDEFNFCPNCGADMREENKVNG